MKTDTDATGARLNELWGVGAAHALYIHDGHWYHLLRRFPGALFDRNGYVLFATEEEYRTSRFLSIGKQISVRKPGISAIPGYVRVLGEPIRLSPFARFAARGGYSGDGLLGGQCPPDQGEPL